VVVTRDDAPARALPWIRVRQTRHLVLTSLPMTVFYPVSLNLEGRRCIVVGGGPVAEKKVRDLLTAGARVVVISPQPTGGLAESAARGDIQLIPRAYRPGDLEGAFLVITDDRALNHSVSEEAERRGIIVNAVDDPRHCSFIAPAVYRQGDLTVAVSTAGKSPALAVRVRDRLGGLLGPEYATLLDLLGEARAEVAARVHDPSSRAALWHGILDSDAIESIRRGDVLGARARIVQLVNEAGDTGACRA
jgi:siroheme synthase-like protein